ncbi:MAG: hypothetical protein ACJAZS_000847 [Alteromonas naphthalenivorans]|jgi:hypothetical protein
MISINKVLFALLLVSVNNTFCANTISVHNNTGYPLLILFSYPTKPGTCAIDYKNVISIKQKETADIIIPKKAKVINMSHALQCGGSVAYDTSRLLAMKNIVMTCYEELFSLSVRKINE